MPLGLSSSRGTIVLLGPLSISIYLWLYDRTARHPLFFQRHLAMSVQISHLLLSTSPSNLLLSHRKLSWMTPQHLLVSPLCLHQFCPLNLPSLQLRQQCLQAQRRHLCQMRRLLQLFLPMLKRQPRLWRNPKILARIRLVQTTLQRRKHALTEATPRQNLIK